MELLAPAGNMEQVNAAIQNGCNALYGGVKEWSARNRAQNFSLEEYNEMIKYCHEKGIRFYLTVNTLLTQTELSDLKEFLTHSKYVKPDAILAADLGVIRFLKQEIKDISIHASTQFGAYCLDDIKILEEIGVERVVLARELSLEEIAHIRKNTKLELEVFVYGAQCLCFSGNCMWGGLVNLGSGNRGRCIGMCDDIYESQENKRANMLHMRPIGLYGEIQKLKEIGIESVKIEGRLRPPKEIAEVVKKLRIAIDKGEGENDNAYAGYLDGKLPVENMLMKEVSEKHGKVIGGNPVKLNEENLRLRTIYRNDEVVGIDYVSWLGERQNYRCAFQTDSTMTVAELFRAFQGGIQGTIYEFISEMSEDKIIYVNQLFLKQTIQSINEEMKKKKQECRECGYTEKQASCDSFVFTEHIEDIKKLHNCRYKRFIYQIVNMAQLKECLKYEEQHIEEIEIIYCLPFLDFTGRATEIYSLLTDRRVMITRLSQLLHAKKYGYKEIYGDYCLNIWNVDAAKYLSELGVKKIIAHPEVPLSNLRAIEEDGALEILYVDRGTFPIGMTRACMKPHGICEQTCTENVIKLYNVNKGLTTKVLCNNIFGYRTLQHDEIYIGNLGCIDDKKKVYVLSGLDNEERDHIISGKNRKKGGEIYREWEKS